MVTMIDANVSGIVFNVQKFSVHDGQGIRTLVFLKGCPLRCKWCSNPESQRLQPEMAFNATRCLTAEVCGRCARACPTGAITVQDGLLRIDRSLCKHCFSCAAACPSGAQNLYGESMTVDQVLNTSLPLPCSAKPAGVTSIPPLKPAAVIPTSIFRKPPAT